MRSRRGQGALARGFVCDRCGDQRWPTHNGRRLWQCKGLRTIKASIVGSVSGAKAALDDVVSGLLLPWSQSKSGISALALKLPPGVSSHGVLLRHKLMQVMF